MTQEQLNSILVKLEGDRSLQKQIKAAKSTKEVVNTFKAQGFAVFADDSINPAKVSGQELEGVAGGLCSGNEWPCSY